MDNLEKQKRTEKFDDFYYNKIGMCGCGRPEDVKKFIFNLLKNHKEERDDEITYEAMIENRKNIISNTDTDVIFEFVFHIFENAELLEHGGSVYGSDCYRGVISYVYYCF